MSKKKEKSNRKERRSCKKAKVSKGQSLPSVRTVHVPVTMPLMPDHEVEHRSLEMARARWENGDWATLMAMDTGRLDADPDRAHLSLILATAHSHAGDMKKARHFAGQALRWGASRSMASRILLSAAQNSVARIAAALLEDPLPHFEAAIRLVQPYADAALLAQNRRIRELVGMGLLPDAAALLQQELGIIQDEGTITDPEQIIRIEAQIEQLLEITNRLPANSHKKKPRVWTIIVAGTPRSGSTWVYNTCRILLTESNKNVYACWQADFQPHSHGDADVHLVKVHGPDELRFPYDLILTTKRDIIDRLASLVRMGWLKQDVEAIKAAKKEHERLYQFWNERTDIEVDFNIIQKHPERAIQSIADLLHVPCSPKRAEVLLRKIEAIAIPEAGEPHDPVTQFHPRHRSDGTETLRIANWIRSVL